MGEIMEALEGCAMILENMSESTPDPRHYAIILALRECIAELSELYEAGF